MPPKTPKNKKFVPLNYKDQPNLKPGVQLSTSGTTTTWASKLRDETRKVETYIHPETEKSPAKASGATWASVIAGESIRERPVEPTYVPYLKASKPRRKTVSNPVAEKTKAENAYKQDQMREEEQQERNLVLSIQAQSQTQTSENDAPCIPPSSDAESDLRTDMTGSSHGQNSSVLGVVVDSGEPTNQEKGKGKMVEEDLEDLADGEELIDEENLVDDEDLVDEEDNADEGDVADAEDVADGDDSNAECPLPSLKPIGLIPARRIGTLEIEEESKTVVLKALDKENRKLVHMASDGLKNMWDMQRVSREKMVECKNLAERMCKLFGNICKRLEKALDNEEVKERHRNAYVATLDTLKSAVILLPWRAEVMERRRWMMEMEYSFRRSKGFNLEIEYPFGQLEFGIASGEKVDYQADKADSTKRRRLIACRLEADEERRDRMWRRVVDDYEYAVRRYNSGKIDRPKDLKAAKFLVKSQSMRNFLNFQDSMGLLMVAWNQAADDRGLASDMSYFAGDLCERVEKLEAYWVIKYFTGLRNNVSAQFDVPQFQGVTGFVRSICVQLLILARHTMDFRMTDAWSDESWKKVEKGDLSMLCQLFRQFLIELVIATEASETHRTILIFVDQAHIFEKDAHREDFFQVVAFLRAICDEAKLADWDNVLNFKYVFFYQGASRLLLRPDPREFTCIPF